jgi:hypothetical protein
MSRSSIVPGGFGNRAALAVTRVRAAVAASLTTWILALCLIVVLTVLSIQIGATMPRLLREPVWPVPHIIVIAPPAAPQEHRQAPSPAYMATVPRPRPASRTAS